MKSLLKKRSLWPLSFLFLLLCGNAFATDIANFRFYNNTISSLNTNGNIILNPNGTGQIQAPDLTANRVLIVDASNNITHSALTTTVLSYLDPTSSVQTQLNTKITNPMTTGGDIIYGGASGTPTRLANGSSDQVFMSQGGTSAPIWGRVNSFPSTSISGATTLTTSNCVVYANVTLAGYTVTLHSAASKVGQVVMIMKLGANALSLTLATTGGESIGEFSSYVLKADKQSITLVSDGSNWAIAGQNFASRNELANQSTQTNYPATTAWGDLVSVSLTPGYWKLSGAIRSLRNSATQAADSYSIGISSTSGNSTTGLTNGLNRFDMGADAGLNAQGELSVPAYFVTVTTTTTFYLKYMTTYSAGGPPTASGYLLATPQ